MEPRFDFEEETTSDKIYTSPLTDLKENYQLVWLDVNASNDSEESIFTHRHLRNTIDFIRKFDDLQECISYIEETEEITTFIMCSGTLGKDLVPAIHDRKNIWAVYVYCYDIDSHKSWIWLYSKIKTIRTSLKYLLKDLIYNIQEYKQHEKEAESDNSIFNFIGRDQRTTDITGTVWSKFINILCHLSYPTDACAKFLDNLKDYYKNDTAKLREIDDFEKNYTPENAILWYTRPIFIYKILNKAFLLRDPQLLFSVGFFVRDLYRQLHEEKEKYKLKHLVDRPVFTVYRGQLISRNEIEHLLDLLTDYSREAAEDVYIINTSFVSTTQDRSVAAVFVIQSLTADDQIQGILFEIDLDIQLKSRPYADITHLSHFDQESETLIAIGCVFKPVDLYYDENEKFWICKLKLMNNSDHYDINEYESTSERRTLKTCINVLLYNDCRGIFEKGIQSFSMLIHLFPEEKWIIVAKAQFLLSNHDRFDQSDNSEYIRKYIELIHMWSDYVDDNEINCFIDIGYIHSERLAISCRFSKNQIDFEKEHYELAIICYQMAIENTSTNYEQMKIYEILSWIHRSQMINLKMDRYEQVEYIRMGIKYQKLQLENSLSYHFTELLRIPNLMQWIAKNHESIDEYDGALIMYDRALKMLENQLHPSFNTILDILKNILKIYKEQKHDLHSILKYKIIEHKYIVRDAYETPLQEYNIHYSVDQQFEFRLRLETIFKSHIELAHCFLDVNDYHMGYEHLSDAMDLAAKNEI